MYQRRGINGVSNLVWQPLPSLGKQQHYYRITENSAAKRNFDFDNTLLSKSSLIYSKNYTTCMKTEIPKFLTPPYERSFISISKDSKTEPSVDSIRVVQYNVLAEAYVNKERYFYCKNESLDWDHRKWNLLSEILKYQPDILCLQELDHFEFWDEQLQIRGFRGVYLKRPFDKTDGIAVFYNISKFKLVDVHAVDYNMINNIDGVRSSEIEARYKRNNVGLLANLVTLNNSKSFVVATTHTYWDPRLADLKLRQSHMLLQEIHYFLRKNFIPKENVIISGDFNSTPESAVYQLYSKGRVEGNHKDTMTYFGSKDDFIHSFILKSAYSHLNEPFTNLTPWFKGTLDYIWYSSGFELESLLEMIPNSKISDENNSHGQLLGLPTTSYSSDHMALVSVLKFSCEKRNNVYKDKENQIGNIPEQSNPI